MFVKFKETLVLLSSLRSLSLHQRLVQDEKLIEYQSFFVLIITLMLSRIAALPRGMIQNVLDAM